MRPTDLSTPGEGQAPPDHQRAAVCLRAYQLAWEVRQLRDHGVLELLEFTLRRATNVEGRAMRDKRVAAGVSLRRLADALGLTHVKMGAIERGIRPFPTNRAAEIDAAIEHLARPKQGATGPEETNER